MGSNDNPRPFPDLPSPLQLRPNDRYLDYNNGALPMSEQHGWVFDDVSEVAWRVAWIREQGMAGEPRAAVNRFGDSTGQPQQAVE
jgi:hypothetical protein